MAPRFLITHSLHQSWNYYHSVEGASREEFLRVLMKIKDPPSDAILKGRKLEADIYDCIYAPLPVKKHDDCIYEIAKIVIGGLWQEKVYKDVRIAGFNCLLYGRVDVLRRDWIYDIKYSGNYETGKYFGSIQHSLYMLCSKIPHFKYIVSDYESVWTEDYHFTDNTEAMLFSEIAAMLDVILGDPEMKEAFEMNWGAK